MPLSSTPFFFFNDTATTEIYTLSLHDALPISCSTAGATCAGNSASSSRWFPRSSSWAPCGTAVRRTPCTRTSRSEEHTSELQSQSNLECRLLLEKKKNNTTTMNLSVSTTVHTH